MENNKYFYCYSYSMMCFLKSYGFRYICKGFNYNSKSRYYLFNKSEDLDKAISIWNTIKFKLKENQNEL